MSTFNDNDMVEIVGVAESFPKLDGECDFWTQLSVPEIVFIPEQKPNIEQIAKVAVEVEIISQRVVKTPTSYGYNLGGQKLTGKKLIIEGKIKQKLFYVADVAEQSMHVAHFQKSFSTFIIIPSDMNKHAKFRIDPYIEDVFVKMNDKREVFKNVTLFLHAVPTNCYCY
ncbi:DUF3794 domain-containing protein [Halanaerobaculum tunisiense]